MASIFSTIAKGAATLGGTAYDYLTPGKGMSRVTQYGASLPKAPSAPSVPNYGGGGSSSTSTTGGPDLAAIYNAQLAAYKAANPPVPIPRLVTMDTGAAWNQAAQMATAAVSPIYQQKMSDFLHGQSVALQQQQASTNTAKTALDTTLANSLADTQTQRTRTSEDTTANIGDINATQDYNARTGGLSFDTAQRALTEGTGAAGTGESGLGRQQVTAAATSYGLQSNEQVRQSTNKVAAANTLMNRTFEDLGTSDTRSTATNVTGKANLEVNLQNFIQNQGLDLTNEQHAEDLAKAEDIAGQTGTNEQKLVNQWLQSLAGKGYTSQEIANAASIYRG